MTFATAFRIGNGPLRHDETLPVAELEHRRIPPAAYGIDFGVLATGRTALIETNDGYSPGACAIGAKAYAGLLFTRWAQLLSTSRSLVQGPP